MTTEVRAYARHIHISHKKIRLLADMVRGKQAQSAISLLRFVQKRGAMPLKKLIESALANASNNFSLPKEQLVIKEIRVDQGPAMKRWTPKAFGSATHIRKESAHISLILAIPESTQRTTPTTEEAKKMAVSKKEVVSPSPAEVV